MTESIISDHSSRWYALSVRHQHEQQTDRALRSQGLQTLMPVYRAQRQWSDRIKEIELPVFAGYVLCRFPLSERRRVADTPGVGGIVGFGGAPAALEESEIEGIRRVMDSKLRWAPWPYLQPGDRVRIERGPRKPDAGRFAGRIWVEEQGNSIVRFNGTYAAGASKHEPAARYFHFDSWRVNVAPDLWVPAQIYVEEEGSSKDGRTFIPRFKAQTRLWGYTSAAARKMDELTAILIESGDGVRDPAAAKDISPLESQRSWERQAEDNVIARLEGAGLVSQPGPVDQMLDTVLSNLVAAADLPVEARCRVLLTTPLETFSIGHTIVVSRGLLDVLPDEASLALVLAAELAHIALGHRTPTQFAFRNQTMLSDADFLRSIRFERTPAEMEAAGKKTIEIMHASPYQKTAVAGLFLKALGSRVSLLPGLLAANLGNQLANAATLARLAEFAATAPELEEAQVQQIAALPLGSRVKLDPWSNRITLIKARPLDILSPREKLPFEITPFVLYLTRLP